MGHTPAPDKKMYVYSGNVRLCEVGLSTKLKDVRGEDLYTGDIIALCRDDGVFTGLTVVVANHWVSYIDGTHVKKEDDLEPFIMGIKTANLTEWLCYRAKSFSDVINDEHWKDYGFNYKAEGK